MVRNQKIHIDANPAVACIRRDRPSGHEHPRGATEPIPFTETGLKWPISAPVSTQGRATAR